MQLFRLTLWGWQTTTWTVLICLVPLRMLLVMHQRHLHQPWPGRLDTFNPFIIPAVGGQRKSACTEH